MCITVCSSTHHALGPSTAAQVTRPSLQLCCYNPQRLPQPEFLRISGSPSSGILDEPGAIIFQGYEPKPSSGILAPSTALAMVKNLERADLSSPKSTPGNTTGHIGAKLRSFTKTRSSRILRLSCHIALALGFLLLLFGVTPGPSEKALVQGYSRVWEWLCSFSSHAQPFNASAIGPTRMVVFGTPDLWTPSTSHGQSRPGWTDALCEEVSRRPRRFRPRNRRLTLKPSSAACLMCR